MRKLVLLLAVLIATMAEAQANSETGLWQTVGNWQIRVDDTLGHGCFMVASYRDGTILRVGRDNRNGTSYLWISNSAWKSMEVGKEYSIGVKLEDADLTTWSATSIQLPGIVFLSMVFNNENVWRLMAVKNAMSFYYNRNLLTYLPLTGTVAAIKSVFDCQQQFSAPKDPFAATSAPDPFAK